MLKNSLILFTLHVCGTYGDAQHSTVRIVSGRFAMGSEIRFLRPSTILHPFASSLPSWVLCRGFRTACLFLIYGEIDYEKRGKNSYFCFSVRGYCVNAWIPYDCS